MGASWALFLHDPNGNRLADLNEAESFELVRVENSVGAVTITLPYAAVPYSFIKRDGIITLERGLDGRPPALFTEQIYFITGRRRLLNRDGSQYAIITAEDANTLLRRRHVLYAAGSAQASRSGKAGDVMRAIVRDNLGTSATASRQVASLGIGGDLGDGATVGKDFAWRNVLQVLQELAQASIAAGTYISFDIVCTGAPGAGSVGLEFRTYAGQRGNDHRYPSGAAGPVLLGPDFGTLDGADYSEDFSAEANAVTALGSGEGSARATATATDTTRSGASPFALCETTVEARNSTAAGGVQAEANARLRAALPVRTFTAKVVDTAGVRFGLEYGFGDLVTAQAFGASFDCRLAGVRVRYTKAGESIDCVLRNDSSYA